MRFVAFVGALVAALLIVWAIGRRALSNAAPTMTPVVDDVHRHFRDHDENESAARFFSTVARFDEGDLGRQREAEINYIRREIASSDAKPPDAALARFLESNAGALRTLRAQLASNPPPLWKLRIDDVVDPPGPDWMVITRLFLMFPCDALSEHSKHNSTAAWSDLGAMWVLAQSMWDRPELTSVLTAMTGSRMIAAVATKLPPPVPHWWSDFIALDPRSPITRSLQYESWTTRTRAVQYPVGEPDDENGFREAMRRAAEPFVRPIAIMQADARIRDMHEIARKLAVSDPCETTFDGEWSSMQRMHRFMVEREGVAKLLVAEADGHVDGTSICRREHWNYRRDGEHFELSFSGHIPTTPTRIVIPLTYRR